MRPHDLAVLYIRKAREDELIAQRLAPMNDVPDTGVGFHAQQAVEKSLKAVLALNEVNVQKTHDIGALLGQLRELDLDIPKELDEAVELTAYSVMARYPWTGTLNLSTERAPCTSSLRSAPGPKSS
jgi:HEPN domain-containing protein